MGLLLNALLVAAFAWVVRGLLGARELTWGRTLVAAAVGYVLGGTLAALLLVDVGELPEAPPPDVSTGEIATLALPFQVVATMAVLVALELLRTRAPRRRTLRPASPWRAVRRALGIARRAAQVTRIASRHGIAPLLGLRRGDVPSRDPGELARRARLALEDAGGMFVKLGQLLATRPDLLPPDALAELGHLHAAARPVPSEAVRAVIADALGASPEDAFASLEPEPLGSASIAQVHLARLHDGTEVVVKVRRPGLEEVTERDLAIVGWVARLAERRTGWGQAYGASALAAEFAEALRAELDFRREARHAAEVAEAITDSPRIRVPTVIAELCSERVLVTERLVGDPLSAPGRDLEADERRALADELCSSQVNAMLHGGRFHGDPHPGNVLVLTDGGLGLIDFGVTGRLDAFERSAVFQMLLALELEEPALLYESLVAVGAVSPTRDPDEIERALARFMATHLGPGLPPAEALPELLRLITALGLRLPPGASVMFRALATLAGTLEQLSPSYPLIEQVARLGGAELEQRTTPSSLADLAQREWVHLGPLVRRAPRHLDRIATLAAHGGLAARVRLFTEAADVAVVEGLLNRALLAVLSLGLGLLAVLMIGTDAGPHIAGTDVRLVEVLGWVALFAASVLLLRVLLQVLRHDSPGRRDGGPARPG